MRDESFEPSNFLQDFNPEFMKRVRFAFKPQIARRIMERDRWTCQCGCGRNLRSGYMLEASHYPEMHQRTPDDNIDHGRVLSRHCHLTEHLDMLQQSYSDYNLASVRLSAQNSWDNGFHTWKYYAQFPEQLEIDRQELVGMLEQRGLDPREFIQFTDQSASN